MEGGRPRSGTGHLLCPRMVEKVGCRYSIEFLGVCGILDRESTPTFLTPGVTMILQVLIAMIAGWINRYQQQVIAYLLEENRTLHAKLGGQRIRFTDAERRRLATLAFPIGRIRLKSLATLATPDTLMRWYKQLVAQKFDGSQKRNKLGRPRVSDEIEALVLQMANHNPTWGYRCIQGSLANLGHRVDKMTVRNTLRRHHIDPAPKRRQSGMRWSQFRKPHWKVLAAP